MQPLALSVFPTACMFLRTPNLLSRLGCWQWLDIVLTFALMARSFFSIHCAAALVSVQVHCYSISNLHPKRRQWLQVPSDMQLGGHVPVGSCSRPLLSPRALPHLLVSRESKCTKPLGDPGLGTHPPLPIPLEKTPSCSNGNTNFKYLAPKIKYMTPNSKKWIVVSPTISLFIIQRWTCHPPTPSSVLVQN